MSRNISLFIAPPIDSFHVTSRPVWNAPLEGKTDLPATRTSQRNTLIQVSKTQKCRTAVVRSVAQTAAEKSRGCVFTASRPIKTTPRGDVYGSAQSNATRSPGRANHGSPPNTHVFAANTSSTVSNAQAYIKVNTNIYVY